MQHFLLQKKKKKKKNGYSIYDPSLVTRSSFPAREVTFVLADDIKQQVLLWTAMSLSL